MIEGTVASIPPQGGRKHPNQDFIQVDTTNILFICGGAFDGLDKLIAKRSDKGGMGFGAQVQSLNNKDTGQLFLEVETEDLVTFGLIPELIGRLPVVATLANLDEAALVNILTQPKNALVKQYAALFDMEDVALNFTDEAVAAIAKKALIRKTGARGLRSIMEEILLDTMYKLPSEQNIVAVEINEDTVQLKSEPKLIKGKRESSQPKPPGLHSLAS